MNKSEGRHWERLFLIVPTSFLAAMGSAIFSGTWADTGHGFTEKAANLGFLIFGGSLAICGFLGIIVAVVMVFESDIDRWVDE